MEWPDTSMPAGDRCSLPLREVIAEVRAGSWDERLTRARVDVHRSVRPSHADAAGLPGQQSAIVEEGGDVDEGGQTLASLEGLHRIP